MSSTFKFHSQVPDIVPWQAQYQFPGQSNKVRKQTVKLPPKNGSSFSAPNTPIRIEFPADNYCNMLNSVLVFNATVTLPVPATGTFLTLQRGGGHNYFSRIRIMYGSLVIEDIQEYKTLVRMISEIAVPKDYMNSSGSVMDGFSASRFNDISLDTDLVDGGGLKTYQLNGNNTLANAYSNIIADATDATAAKLTGVQAYASVLGSYFESSDAVGQNLVGGQLTTGNGTTTGCTFTDGGNVSSNQYTKTFALNLLSGLLTCKKLIPLKWMASQLTVELTLADASQVFITDMAAFGNPVKPLFTIDNVNFLAEMLEFDSTYDLAFFQGLSQDAGVPIKFSSWHYHPFSLTSAVGIYQVHERSRSVKSAYAVVRQATPYVGADSDIFFHNLNEDVVTVSGKIASRGTTSVPTTCPISEFQWRIGGQYYPAQPVSCTYGAPEAYIELMKAVDVLGDYTISSSVNNRNFTINYTNIINGEGSKFVMGASFETPAVGSMEINGINAEEQCDLALSVKCGSNFGGTTTFNNGTNTAKKLEVFVNYDTMLIIRKGNVVDLIL